MTLDKLDAVLHLGKSWEQNVADEAVHLLHRKRGEVKRDGVLPQ